MNRWESEKKVSWTFSAFFQTLSRPFATEEYHISNQCIWWRRQSRPNEDSNELRCAGLCSFSIIHCLPPFVVIVTANDYTIPSSQGIIIIPFFLSLLLLWSSSDGSSVAGDRSNLSAAHVKNGSQISQIIILYFRVITFCKFWGEPL